ncbi:sperm acrosome-associated protein 7-like isoform X2 [Canis lupus familiaris]|uniref:sperm acrosome-associated protein 7-like isoform X2 n=1 Tax=Canis lupus dingo TaxID=286419 RepID=UPI000DC6B73C|nr:sperm acrosome-associated protein 7-like isoform X2 [Canis lupus dingo]XP_038287404.1 sperm acrosome-associated protein 7-like isoform X2 [Canis lupus familiaris]XP_038312725.1 sperm acrosome-associated protein 7-like isoform X2 [Canis lupus familiaris]XP_038425986.1 sperm acrosome-associated protein 7-like isoform X2 [Canis lupus familiaris]
MAGNRGMTVFVLLLSCWHEAKLHPVRIFSGPSTVLPPNLRILDDDVAGVFDEILVQEILDPSNSSLLVTQRLLSKSRALKKENTHTEKEFKTGMNKKYHEKELSSENEDASSLNEEEETFYQIKSLAALEKIIYSLRRALGKTLQQKIKKHKHLFRGAKNHKGRQRLN